MFTPRWIFMQTQENKYLLAYLWSARYHQFSLLMSLQQKEILNCIFRIPLSICSELEASKEKHSHKI